MSLPLASETANKKNHGRVVLWSIIALIVGLLVGHMATYHVMHHHRFAGFTTPYQAVLLINGTVYYGKQCILPPAISFSSSRWGRSRRWRS
jgi:hypothetical protein